jgi:GNAT superfamily N-acetyltransferase
MNAEQTLVAQSPQSFTETEIQDFIAMVRAGGEVEEAVLKRNVRNAKCLVFLRRGLCLTGVAALKNPLPTHRKTIKSKAGVAIKASEFPFELGYFFVLPSARRQGLSVELARAALSAIGVEGVFATSRIDNVGMHTTLRKFGFVKAGTPYPSDRGNHQLQLFVRHAAQPGVPQGAPQAARP